MSERAPRVFRNARIHTLGAAGTARAIAVADGRVLAVGDDAPVCARAGAGAESIDLGGAVVVPGFVETHMHPLWYGMNLAQTRVTTPPCRSIGDVVAALAETARATPPGEVVRGWGFDDSAVTEDRGLTARDLDRASTVHPIVVHHLSYHGLYANSFAMRAAGIGPDTPDREGGLIRRDARGAPTGEFREQPAERLVADAFPLVGAAIWRDAVPRAVRELLAVGVTSVHDAWVQHPDVWEAWAAAHRDGALPVRVRAYLHPDVYDRIDPATAPDDPGLRVGGVKLVSDGSIQLHTACLSAPYHDQPGHRGHMVLPLEALHGLVRRFHARGVQVAIHAIGDAAIDAALDAVEAAMRGVPSAAPPHRLEHVTTLRDDQIERVARLGLGLSVFTNHVYYWGDRHRDRFLGPERAARIAPLRSIAAAGIPYGLHCDCPVTPVDPLASIAIAVRRRTRAGHALGPEQRVDVGTALAGYTTEAARLGGEAHEKGSLDAGKLADFAVLDGDPFAVDEEALAELRVRATVIGGEIVHEA